MEQIRLTQTQALLLAGSVAHESSDGPASVPATIDEQVITEEVLGVRQGHRKGIRRIVKGKRNAPDTSCSTIASGQKQSQVAEDQCRLAERVDVQQYNIEAQHRKINAFKAFITQVLNHALPPHSPPPPPPSDDTLGVLGF